MYKPLEDRVIVKLIKEEQTSKSGLVIASISDEKPSEGVVVAVGPGITLQDGSKVIPDVSVGDKVIFSKYAGTDIKIDETDHLILQYRDIFAIIG